ncbi:hypothetical protein BH11ACT7_BH11ACT7_14640 [soil metagenome]
MAIVNQHIDTERPNATGHLDSGAGGRTVVLTGHLDTKPPSHGWTVADPFSGALIDGAIYGQGGPFDVDFDFDELAHPVNAVALL